MPNSHLIKNSPKNIFFWEIKGCEWTKKTVHRDCKDVTMAYNNNNKN